MRNRKLGRKKMDHSTDDNFFNGDTGSNRYNGAACTGDCTDRSGGK